MSISKNPTKLKWFKWYHLYYFLAAFDVLTILASLYLNHTVLEIYSASLEENSVWSNRVSQYSHLNILASDVNAPGNDAFDSGNIIDERRRLAESYQTFQNAITTARDDLEQNVGMVELIRQLDLVNEQVSLIHKEATAVFIELENNHQEAAGSRMAQMDRYFSRSLRRIGELCQAIREIQANRFDIDTARAQRHGQFELTLSGVVCLILCLVTWYGHKMAEFMRLSENQNELGIRRLEGILNSAVVPIITISSRGLIKLFNPAAEQLFGYLESEILEKNISQLMPSPYREEHDGYLEHYLETGMQKVIGIGQEVVGQRKDGTTFPLHLSVSKVILDDNEIIFTGIIRDLTIQKDQETRIRKLHAAVEQSPANIMITNLSGEIEYVNSQFIKTTGYTEAESVGQNPRMLNSGETSRETYTQMWETLEKGEVWQGEFHNQKKNGEQYWELATISPIKDSNGQPTHYVAIKEDITEKKQMQASLVEAKESAEAANLAKSEFLANMSHEIRTPMTAILGFSDMLIENVVKPENIDSARTIKRNGESLIGLINDILDLSKIEAGKYVVEQINCSIHQIIADVASLLRVRSISKGLPLDVKFDGEIPKTICTDPTRLRQILINIVGNAIKFTETGSIQIVTRLLNEPVMDPKLQIDVIDTGIGIPRAKIESLFQPFMQVDNSATRQFGGTGLGLSISKRLVELLGGEMLASSTVGKGSVFSITVSTGPLENVQLIQNAPKVAIESVNENQGERGELLLTNYRILLAEDGPDNQRLISFVLKKAGAEVTLADNGQIAFELATSAKSKGCPFDVVLMDMQMPILDGYSATRRLREKDYTSPIIALTAHAMSTDRQKCLDAGCDDYATKPIDREKLIELIVNYSKNLEIIK